MGNTLSREEIMNLVSNIRHCSQVVVGQWADEFGVDEELAIKMMGPFGGGGFHGEMCGAVSGALAVLGAEYGNYELGDMNQNMIMIGKIAEFKEKFKDKFGAIVCRELLKDYDIDFSREGDLERFMESPVAAERCLDYIKGALDILDEMMG